MLRQLAIVCVLLGLGVCGTVYAGTYTESVNGDLSNDGLKPTEMSIGLGSNPVYGTTGKVTATDRDYFKFTVPAGMVLSEIKLLPGTTVGGGLSFFGIQAGSAVTLSPSVSTATGLLGWTHYGLSDINKDLLPAMAVPANGSSGFSIPLPAGEYAMWLQDFGPGSVSYGLDFTVQNVPEPTIGLAAMGMMGSLVLTTRRSMRGR